MRKSQRAVLFGLIEALAATVLFIIYHITLNPSFRIWIIILCLVAVWDLIGHMKLERKEIAHDRYKAAMQIQEQLKKQWREKFDNGKRTDSAAEDEKSADDADPK